MSTRRNPRFIEELKEFIRFPGIASQRKHAGDLQACARWLAGHVQKIGLENVKLLEAGGPPVVYADWMRDPRRRTILIYGHYDVQPADPLKEWRTPPFEPQVRDGYLYGRGASDDKGQVFAHIKALESLLQESGSLPANVRLIVEGEEEAGSPHLRRLLESRRRDLACHAAVISDMPMPARGKPGITYSMRGDLSLEAEVESLDHDLHSGLYGGAVLNPLQAVCEGVARLHDSAGRVAVAGFYDAAQPVTAEGRRFMKATGPGRAEFLRNAGARSGWGEPGYSLYERATIRPCITVNGIVGGYQGEGGKAVIPARASVKLNLRLVPDQDWREIARLVAAHFKRSLPAGARCRVKVEKAAEPVAIGRGDPAIRAAAAAYRRGFGREPAFLRSGGTLPVAQLCQDVLGVTPVLMGFALPDDRMHAPNERFALENFYAGIETSRAFLAEVAA